MVFFANSLSASHRPHMHIAYYAHSYRDVDARIVDYFAQLMRSEGITPSLDPPSHRVNSAKLERHLNSSDGMVAVVTVRDGGISPHILYEIGLCRRARRPLVVFVEDRLPDAIVPSRILQRRFSRGSFLRQVREHRHALQMFKGYLGEQPPPRYQPPTSRRSCVLIGAGFLDGKVTDAVSSRVEEHGYAAALLSGEALRRDELEVVDSITCADLALHVADDTDPSSQMLVGMARTALVPTITLSSEGFPVLNPATPEEYRPRAIPLSKPERVCETVAAEIRIFEEDFIDLDNQGEVDTYARLLVDIGTARGSYSRGIRDVFVKELIMRDQYNVKGNVGAMGPNAHAHDISINQYESPVGIDLQQLADELGELRTALSRMASEPEQYSSLAEVASAEKAARQGQGGTALDHLKKAGAWIWTAATQIGVGVATEAAKAALGVPK